eukprot:gene34354-42371_t
MFADDQRLTNLSFSWDNDFPFSDTHSEQFNSRANSVASRQSTSSQSNKVRGVSFSGTARGPPGRIPSTVSQSSHIHRLTTDTTGTSHTQHSEQDRSVSNASDVDVESGLHHGSNNLSVSLLAPNSISSIDGVSNYNLGRHSGSITKNPITTTASSNSIGG